MGHDRDARCNVFTYLAYSERMDLNEENATVIAFEKLQFPQEIDEEISRDDYGKEERILAHGIRHLGLLVKLGEGFYRTRMSATTLKLLKQKRVTGPAGKLS